jgi:hypothetical protein
MAEVLKFILQVLIVLLVYSSDDDDNDNLALWASNDKMENGMESFLILWN